MTLTKLEKWEKKLDNILDELDDVLEDHYGKKYRLHPNRPDRNTTANKSMDGLFDITASFTLGLGSEYGRGYVLKIKMVTLEKISEEVRNLVDKIALKKIAEKLPLEFPGRKLEIRRDGHVIKIFGDLNLDEI
ncbi:MAG: hypothetical protein JXQ65_07025 [Candidatus Marinimicrobia bacterium]|nr:hypothetical protein [Candidatus Neomarinimicrobiota bacterium]